MKKIQLPSEQTIQKIRQEIINNESYKFVKELDELIYLPFEEFFNILVEKYGLYTENSIIKDESILHIENYYALMNGITFYCDCDKLDKPLNRNKADDITTVFKMLEESSYDGIIVNLSAVPNGFIRVNKLLYHIKREKDDKEYKIYSITITKLKDNDISSLNFYIAPELYPRILSNDIKTNNSMNVTFIDRRLEQKAELYIYGYGPRNQDALFPNIYFEELLNLMLTCFNRFMNRKKIYKKGKEKHDGIHTKIQTQEDIKQNTYHFTPISDICIYERKTGTTVHGHHASPREHKRTGHWRTYKKTGHKVWIPECIVNKGCKTGKTIYKLK